jgi:hypothetical protein
MKRSLRPLPLAFVLALGACSSSSPSASGHLTLAHGLDVKIVNDVIDPDVGRIGTTTDPNSAQLQLECAHALSAPYAAEQRIKVSFQSKPTAGTTYPLTNPNEVVVSYIETTAGGAQSIWSSTATGGGTVRLDAASGSSYAFTITGAALAGGGTGKITVDGSCTIRDGS